MQYLHETDVGLVRPGRRQAAHLPRSDLLQASSLHLYVGVDVGGRADHGELVLKGGWSLQTDSKGNFRPFADGSLQLVLPLPSFQELQHVIFMSPSIA